MVYLVWGGLPARQLRARAPCMAGRPWLYCAVRGASADDVRTMSVECAVIYDAVWDGEPWWCGWTLESHARRLLALGRVREVRAAELLSVGSGLIAGDDGIIR